MRLSRRIYLLAACAVAACSASAGSRAPGEEVPPASVIRRGDRSSPAVDLSGSWATGSGPEPTVAKFTVHTECNYSPAAWILQQTGDSLMAWTFPARRSQGIARKDTPSLQGASGTVSGLDVTLVDGVSRYALRYDTASGHLRGTRDGSPFWAIRQEMVRPQGCIPIP
ncbi:MAG: hypothetical protein JWN53_61 [Gemmatimonadetes bacterium]|jgi:hypothetical protein|nr:hypothetical protein [Gemmatimonadota bacterium]